MRRALIIGGQAESLVNFRAPVIRALQERKWQVVAAAPQPFPAAVRHQLTDLGAEVCEFSMSRASLNPMADLASYFELRRLLQTVDADAILSYTAKPVIYTGLTRRLKRNPFRCAWITGLGFGFTSGGGWRRVLARGALESGYRAALKSYNVVLFQNQDDLDVFRDRGLLPANQRVHVTAGSGVDTTRFAPTPLARAPVFLMAARLLRDKGIYEFVDAARQVKKRHPQAHFILAGDSDANPASVTRDEVEEWQREGVLEYVGWADDIRDVMSRCRIFVLPSYREGMPRSVLEAMAMGRPVITSDAPGCRDAVENGRTGLLVPVRDSSALANAMERFIANEALAEALGQAGRARAVERFDSSLVGAWVADLLCQQRTQ